VRAVGIEVGVDLVQVEAEHAERVSAVDDRVNPLVARQGAYFLGGKDQAGGACHVAKGDDPGLRSDVVVEEVQQLVRIPGGAGYVDFAHLDAVARGAEPPRFDTPGVLVGGRQHLVAAAELEARGDDAHAVGGVACQRDLVGIGSDEFGQLRAHLPLALARQHSLARRVLANDPVVFQQGVEYGVWRGAVGTVVEENDFRVEHRRLPHCSPESLVVRPGASGQCGYLRGRKRAGRSRRLETRSPERRPRGCCRRRSDKRAATDGAGFSFSFSHASPLISQ